ncbi:MAG: DUF2752 domain-containing protein [Clostridia bacterium]|nr:DUF2752 domain-containing protein [Clostridia bacterium]
MKFRSYHDYIAFAIITSGLIILALAGIFKLGLFKIPACIFFTEFGFYCPACGGTRAFICLLHGDLFGSFYCNPIVIFTMVALFGYFGLYIGLKINSINDKLLSKYCKICFYFFVFILIINFIIRNILLLIYNIRI